MSVTNGNSTAPEARWDLRLTILLTAINILGGTMFWLSLPEKMKQTKEQLADHELRIRVLEKSSADTSGLLSRIDERTKTIQESIGQLRQDFQFRATISPK